MQMLRNERATSRIVIATVCLALGACLPTQKVTAFKTGQWAAGDRTQCTYDGAGMSYYRSVPADQRCPDRLTVPAPSRNGATTRTLNPVKVATLTGVTQLEAGKVCEYDFAGRKYAKSVDSYRGCSPSMRIP